MSQVIDVACDICGQQYQWSHERVGDSATCRQCGTKFDVEEYFPPSEEDDEAAVNNPLPWIKGACVASLILVVLGGLSSLLIYRPGGHFSHIAPTASIQWPAVAPHQPANVTPPQPAKFTPAQPPNVAPAHPVNVPNVDPARAAEARFEELLARNKPRNKRQSPPGAALPDAKLQSPVAPQSPVVPQSPAAPKTLARKWVIPGKPTGIAPEVTAWILSKRGADSYLRLRGRGFSTVNASLQVSDGVLPRGMKFRLFSDTELELGPIFPTKSDYALFMVASKGDMAVLFSEDLPIIDKPRTLDIHDQLRVCLIPKGGQLTSVATTAVLLESGGRAEATRYIPLALVKQGAELQIEAGQCIYVEPGAILTSKDRGGYLVFPSTSIRFCRLPHLDF